MPVTMFTVGLQAFQKKWIFSLNLWLGGFSCLKNGGSNVRKIRVFFVLRGGMYHAKGSKWRFSDYWPRLAGNLNPFEVEQMPRNLIPFKHVGGFWPLNYDHFLSIPQTSLKNTVWKTQLEHHRTQGETYRRWECVHERVGEAAFLIRQRLQENRQITPPAPPGKKNQHFQQLRP